MFNTAIRYTLFCFLKKNPFFKEFRFELPDVLDITSKYVRQIRPPLIMIVRTRRSK